MFFDPRNSHITLYKAVRLSEMVPNVHANSFRGKVNTTLYDINRAEKVYLIKVNISLPLQQ